MNLGDQQEKIAKISSEGLKLALEINIIIKKLHLSHGFDKALKHFKIYSIICFENGINFFLNCNSLN